VPESPQRSASVVEAKPHQRTHRDICPMPDTEFQLRQCGNHPRPDCKHRFPDGKTAWRHSHFQVQGVPAESRRCALCRLRVVLYFEEEA